MANKVNICTTYLEKPGNEGEKYCQMLMHSKAKEKEPFVKLEWAPYFLRHNYAPEHLDGDAAAASPIVFAFRNRQLRYGHSGPWCIGTATWLIVEKGPVIVFGIDLDHALRDSKDPVATTQGLVDKMESLSGVSDMGNRVRFQVYATAGSVLWVPPGIALALYGTAEGGTSAVAFFPWQSSALAAEHRIRNDICGKTISALAVSCLRTHKSYKFLDRPPIEGLGGRTYHSMGRPGGTQSNGPGGPPDGGCRHLSS